MKKAYRFDSLEECEKLRETFGEEYFDYVPNLKDDCKGYLYHNGSGGYWTSGEPDADAQIVSFKNAMSERKIMKIGDKVKCIKRDVKLEVGKTYTISDIEGEDDGWDSEVILIRVVGLPSPYYMHHFEPVCVETLEEKIALAKSYIGKKVIGECINNPFTVEKVYVVTDKDTARKLDILSLIVEEYLETNGNVVVLVGGYIAVPLDVVELVPETVTIKLNDDYSATVYNDRIEVGCQTFPISILKELSEAHKSIL